MTNNTNTQRRTFTTTHTATNAHGDAYQYTLNTRPKPCEIIINADKLTAKIITRPVMDKSNADNNATTCGVVGDMVLQALHRNILAGRVVPNAETLDCITTLYTKHTAGFMLSAAAKQHKQHTADNTTPAVDFDNVAADFGEMLHTTHGGLYFSNNTEILHTNDHDTPRRSLVSLLNLYGVNPTQHADFTARLKAALYCYFMREIVEFIVTNDETDVLAAYNRRNYVGGYCYTTSCMWKCDDDDNVAEALRVYSTPYDDNKFSVGVLLLRLRRTGAIIGRAVVRQRTTRAKQYNRLYSDHAHIFEAAADDFGFYQHERALYGARFPLITTGRAIRFPYIDGGDEMRDVRMVETETAKFLQISGDAGHEIGRAHDTHGFLVITSSHGNFDDHNDDDDENRFFCNYCEEYHDRDNMTNTADGLVCDGCVSDSFSYCDDCDTYHHNDNVQYVSVGNIHTGDTDDRSVCDNCIDDYFTVPSDTTGTYYEINSIR
jgi:hypothetical protein